MQLPPSPRDLFSHQGPAEGALSRCPLLREEKVVVLEQGSCRALNETHPAREGCAMRWLLKGHDLAVPLDALYERVDEAIALLTGRRPQQGQQGAGPVEPAQR